MHRFFHSSFAGLPISLAFALTLAACDRPKSDPERNTYCSVGSAEFNMLMDHWSAGFSKAEADGAVLHEGRGNDVGPRALLNGRCDMAPLSRKMSNPEIDDFVRRYGAEPLAVPVAVDALGVVVPASYSIDVITPDDVYRVFHLGADQVRSFQSDAGDEDIAVYGVNSASERYRWFKTIAVHGDKFSDRVIEVADPLRLVRRVSESGGVGYARLSEMQPGLKTLKIDMGFGKIVSLTPEAARSGVYPFTRFFYIYLPPPGRAVDPRIHKFIDYVLSESGQRVLAPLGLYSLARKERIYNANRLATYRGKGNDSGK